MKKAEKELKEFLKEWCMKHISCDIQHDGWPCGTCFYDFLDKMKVPKTLQHRFWQLVLWVRGDYKDFDFDKQNMEN